MKTVFLPHHGLIGEPDDADRSEDRHLHIVFPAPVCPDIEELLFYLEKPYTVSFEPDSVLLPRLSIIEGQSESGEVWERLFEVIDAPVLTKIGLYGFDNIPAPVFQKTTLKNIDLDGARVPVSIPDDIRNLVNLEHFKLWRAGVSTVSPELFLLPRIQEISFYRVYGYEPTPEVIAAAEAFVAAGGRLESEWDAFPSAPNKRVVPEVSSESLPPDPGQERRQKTEEAAVFVLPDREESSECLQGPKERPVIVVKGNSYCCMNQAAATFESECLDGTKPLSKTAGVEKTRHFGRLADGISPNALDAEPSQPMPKILIADDNAIKRKVLSAMLRKLGCRPEFVSNGAECVERLKTGDFDMILMDIQMPVLDGLQAAREIRALGKSVWITALIHDVTPGDVSACTESGMDDCLVDLPLRLSDVMQAIKKFRAARAKPTQ